MILSRQFWWPKECSCQAAMQSLDIPCSSSTRIVDKAPLWIGVDTFLGGGWRAMEDYIHQDIYPDSPEAYRTCSDHNRPTPFTGCHLLLILPVLTAWQFNPHFSFLKVFTSRLAFSQLESSFRIWPSLLIFPYSRIGPFTSVVSVIRKIGIQVRTPWHKTCPPPSLSTFLCSVNLSAVNIRRSKMPMTLMDPRSKLKKVSYCICRLCFFFFSFPKIHYD